MKVNKYLKVHSVKLYRYVEVALFGVYGNATIVSHMLVLPMPG